MSEFFMMICEAVAVVLFLGICGIMLGKGCLMAYKNILTRYHMRVFRKLAYKMLYRCAEWQAYDRILGAENLKTIVKELKFSKVHVKFCKSYEHFPISTKHKNQEWFEKLTDNSVKFRYWLKPQDLIIAQKI